MKMRYEHEDDVLMIWLGEGKPSIMPSKAAIPFFICQKMINQCYWKFLMRENSSWM